MRQEPETSTSYGPLKGIRIIDFCSFINGAYSAALMGEMGAEVIKVEPLSGDLSRAWGPFLRGESRFYQAWNRNKRGIALDLSTAEGREIAYELIRDADVVIENYRNGVTERLGIDYQRVREINPRVIYCTSTAFGTKGPHKDRPAYDPVLQTLSGIVRDNKRLSGNIAPLPVAVSDYQASMLVVMGVLAALYHRERTGQGQRIETSLLQGVLSIHAHYFVKGLECDEEGALGIYPYQLFETLDDHIYIAAGTDKFWKLLCETLGLPELGDHEKYNRNFKRTANAAELTALLQPVFKTKTTAEWESALLEKGVPCGAVGQYLDFLNDPQVSAMNMNPVIAHPVIGEVQMVGIPVHFEQSQCGPQRPAPMLGQHSEEILKELGYDQQRIEEWKENRIVGTWKGNE